MSGDERYTINQNGDLTIRAIKVEDNGIFVCKIDTTSGIKTFAHNITVVQLPFVHLRVSFQFVVGECTKQSEVLSKDFVESKLVGKICSRDECRMTESRTSCAIEFGIPVLEVTLFVDFRGSPDGRCDVHCTLSMLNDLKEKVKKIALKSVIEGKRLKLPGEKKDLPVSYFNTEDLLICDPGFQIKQIDSDHICFPCTPGTFLEQGYCIPCPRNQYANHFTSTECVACKEGLTTDSRGATSAQQCHDVKTEVRIGVLVVYCLLPFFLVCCSWWCRRLAGDSVVGRCMDRCFHLMVCNCNFRKTPKEVELEYAPLTAITAEDVTTETSQSVRGTLDLTSEEDRKECASVSSKKRKSSGKKFLKHKRESGRQTLAS